MTPDYVIKRWRQAERQQKLVFFWSAVKALPILVVALPGVAFYLVGRALEWVANKWPTMDVFGFYGLPPWRVSRYNKAGKDRRRTHRIILAYLEATNDKD